MSQEYLNTLYKDFETKLHSINVYMEKISNNTGDLNQVTKEWAHLLKAKFEAVNQFEASRPKTTPATQFAIELPPNAKAIDSDAEEDIKDLDIKINDASEMINYRFVKAQTEIQFLVQSYQSLQDIVNQIYQVWSDLIEMRQS